MKQLNSSEKKGISLHIPNIQTLMANFLINPKFKSN